MQAPEIKTSNLEAYSCARRQWQGIPGIERAPSGRLWATWYSGGKGEDGDNYVLLVTSNDDGKTWSEPKIIISPVDKVRAFDPVLWHSPDGKMRLFWAQSYGWFDGRAGVWSVVCENSDSESPSWSSPQRHCNGVMMNKPIVTTKGEWLMPAALWSHKAPIWPFLENERYSNVFCSIDCGKSWNYRGHADIEKRDFDEHMIVEKKDKSLWMLVRTSYGIGESFSDNNGEEWSEGKDSNLTNANSRFFIRRLNSGRLILVKHHTKITDKEWRQKRSDLTAFLSDDDGKSWKGSLLLDERSGVSYPDGVEAANGQIYIVYDRNRSSDKEILMATIREEDILKGKCISGDSRLKQLINKA
jgi:hypothetical protein